MARNVVRKVLPPVVILIIIVGLAAITITNFFTRSRGPVVASGFIEARSVDVSTLVAGRIAKAYATPVLQRGMTLKLRTERAPGFVMALSRMYRYYCGSRPATNNNSD